MTQQSSYDKLRAVSKYHFDNWAQDPRWDTVIELGHFVPDWTAEVTEIIANSKPATWETRGFKGEHTDVPKPELADEEYDLERVGIDPKVVITNLNWAMPPVLQKVSDLFGFEDVMNRIHVQMPGQLWNLHIDKLYKWFPDHPEKVMRIFVQLTDWQPGQFWQYGNYNWGQWRAGSVTTFDWQNVPHSTANAGFHPRVTLQITGIKTDVTEDFLQVLRDNKSVKL
jgi:hypothetical protein